MAYSEFTLPVLVRQFGLTIEETADLFAAVPETMLRPAFQAQLDELVPLALAVSSEKARSELIIAPVLLELWRMMGQRIGFFSGILFDVDKAQGLDGFCDYILTRTPRQLFIEAPIVMLVEAKNEDMKRGYGQCLAEMLAAQRFNAADGHAGNTVYGAVTTGERWKFLQLGGVTARIDSVDYYLEHIGKIMGILLYLMHGDTPADGLKTGSE
jgi:hypothetical protein